MELLEEEKEEKRNYKAILAIVAVILMLFAVVGISFAIFRYSKRGVVENTVTTGTIKMNYTESTNGINITNAMPMTEAQAISQTVVNNSGVNPSNENTSVSDNVFDFTVDAEIKGNTTVNYDVYAVKNPNVMSAEAGGVSCNNVDVTSAAYASCNLIPDNAIRLRLEESTAGNGTYDNVIMSGTQWTEVGSNDPLTGREDTDVMVLHKSSFGYDNKNASDERTKNNFGKTDGTKMTRYYRLRMWVDKDAYTLDSHPRKYSVLVYVHGKSTN